MKRNKHYTTYLREQLKLNGIPVHLVLKGMGLAKNKHSLWYMRLRGVRTVTVPELNKFMDAVIWVCKKTGLKMVDFKVDDHTLRDRVYLC